jgi:hypothetical protein
VRVQRIVEGRGTLYLDGDTAANAFDASDEPWEEGLARGRARGIVFAWPRKEVCKKAGLNAKFDTDDIIVPVTLTTPWSFMNLV